jgi:hypothetical protein
MKEAPGSSETSVLTRATWRNNPEDTILHSHRRENLKSYNYLSDLHFPLISHKANQERNVTENYVQFKALRANKCLKFTLVIVCIVVEFNSNVCKT